MFFFICFRTTRRSVHLVEQSIGPCQFCEAKASVDIMERRSQSWWFGLLPTPETVDRMAVCRCCGRRIKEVYYTMRESYYQVEPTSPVAIEGTCLVDEEHGNIT